MWISWQAIAIAGASLLISRHYSRYLHIPLVSSVHEDSERWSCRPFLPNLFAETAPSLAHPAIQAAIQTVDRFFATRFSEGDIDSLSIAVVMSNSVPYEKNFGVMKGNDTTTSLPTTSHSMYRIASVAKLFAVLEGFILEQKGVISWDDPVTRYLKNFAYQPEGLDVNQSVPSLEEAPMTLYQLATHISGLGRDWPPGTVEGWPENMFGVGPPPTNGHPFPSHQALLDAIAKHHLTSPPASYPAYSNTGTGLLGIILAAASSAAAGDEHTISYADLLKRDIFDPMGLNGSHFLVTDANKHLIVVPSVGSEVADQDFLDAMNPAAGQFSSLSDAITVTQTLLNPRHPQSQITPYSHNRWLQPVHTFEEDDWTELGFMWEIVKAQDSNGRLRKIYWKLGAMVGYHAALAIHPGTGYGVVVLMTGRYPDAAKLAYNTFELFQPGIDEALADLAVELYAGTWVDFDSENAKNSSARIVVEKGTLYIEEFTLLGVDALKKFGATGRLALRSSGRRDELRIDTGIPGYNGLKHMGCYPYWNGQDLWGVRNGAAINAMYFNGSGEERRLHVPSLSLVLRKHER